MKKLLLTIGLLVILFMPAAIIAANLNVNANIPSEGGNPPIPPPPPPPPPPPEEEPVLGCTDPVAINYNPAATVDDGSCEYPRPGCTDPLANNYNPNANQDDGSCRYPRAGCTDPAATNYNPSARRDDGSCVYAVAGCTDPAAINYNPAAVTDDGSCIIYGCTDQLAENYNPAATENDGSCVVAGCTNVLAENYNPAATVDDDSCIIYGCSDPTAVNYNPEATVDNGTCSYDQDDVPGCLDASAINYNPEATVDNGTCLYPISGCTAANALNYNPAAEINDGSCVFPIPVVEPPAGAPLEVEPEFWFYTNNYGLRIYLGGLLTRNNIDLLVGRELSILLSDKLPGEVNEVYALLNGQKINFKYDSGARQYVLKLNNFNRVGKFDLGLVISYADGAVYARTIRVNIHPLGQVFSKLPADQTRIFGIGVFVYDEAGNIVVGARKINADGTYGFMVPNGRYKLVVFDNGEKVYDGRFFTVRNNIINRKIGLTLWEQVVEALTAAADLINERVLDNPAVEQVNRYAAPAVVTTVSVTTFAAIPWWSLVHYLQYFFTEPLLWLFRRRRRGWGVVYDAITKQPVDLAVVRLYDKKTNRLIKSKVTDKQGRYNFFVDSGEYYLEAVKPDKIFPSRVLQGAKEDKQYADLYYGEIITVTQQHQGIITANIPVDPEGKDLSVQQVLRGNFWYRVKRNVSIVGPVFSLISLIISPGLLTAAFLIIHLILYLLFQRLAKRAKPTRWGVVLDAQTGQPLASSVAKIYSPEYNKMLEAQVTDRRGRYGFLAGNNVYYLSAIKSGYAPAKTENIDLTGKKSDEVIGRDIKLTPAREMAPPAEEVVAAKPAVLVKPEVPAPKPATEPPPAESGQPKEESELRELAEKIKQTAAATSGDIKLEQLDQQPTSHPADSPGGESGHPVRSDVNRESKFG